MTFKDIYGKGRFGLSFELYPPKNPEGDASLFQALPRLAAFRPSMVTCTYGAGGSTRAKTLDVLSRVRRELGVSVAAHLTCVGSTKAQIESFLLEAEAKGIESIVALRGDPPRGEENFTQPEGGLGHADELVGLIRERNPGLGIAVAGYPEKHQEAPSLEEDLRRLQGKVFRGADAVITQLFYVNKDFFSFRSRCQDLGIRVPVVPGIMPVLQMAQIQRITQLSAATLPRELLAALEEKKDRPEGQVQVGVDYAIRQCRELLDSGVPGIHFYVLNKADSMERILGALSLQGTA